MTFKDLNIVEPILKSLKIEGYTHPTPIQEQSIPILLKGKDLLGCAQTGTGKTAAFAIPIIQHLYNDRTRQLNRRKIKALVVTPTRELAIQIGENFIKYAKFTNIKTTVIFGGVKQGKQVNRLKDGVDVLIATPGRLLDLIDQGFITLRNIEYFVLDEADHMLDMGFIVPIRKIVAKLPERRHSLFFSATMPPSIVELSGKILGHPERVTIKPEQATAERVEQAVYMVAKSNKTKLLIHLLKEKQSDTTLVFSRTKYGADKIVKKLYRADIKAAAIHGNKSQNARQRALKDFKEGRLEVLVATDIAARGIDVSNLPLVINYDLPNIAETYVHRIGRTGRARASGLALSFCNEEERAYLKDIQKLIRQEIEVIDDQPYVDDLTEIIVKKKPQQRKFKRKPKPQGQGGSRRSGGNSSGSSGRWKGKKKSKNLNPEVKPIRRRN